ncbi:MAG: LysR family transcriptional regulator [Bacillus sp. (in: firmicutes)]
MHLKDLQYFQQLVKEGNFTKAAKTFHVSQPTITYAIKRLEEELDTKLIIRNQAHHSLTITEAGRILSAHAKNIIEELDVAQTEIHRLKDEKFECGLPPIIGNYYFPKISVDLIEKGLMQNIHIVNGGSQDLFRLLKKGKLDMAMLGSTQPIRDELLNSELLVEKNFKIVVSPNHRLAKRKSISFSELKNEAFVLFNEHYIHPNIFKKIAQQAQFTPNVIYQNSDLNILKGMIREQVGISFLAEIAISKNDDLVALPIDDQPQPSFMISLVKTKKPTQSPQQKHIIELIRQYAY